MTDPPHGCEQWRPLVQQYGWDENIAMAVMEAESTCNQNNIGDNRVIGGLYAPSCGLFQIRTLEGRPTCDQLKDPAVNIEWAWKLYNSPRGWTHWSVYNDNSYLKFL